MYGGLIEWTTALAASHPISTYMYYRNPCLYGPPPIIICSWSLLLNLEAWSVIGIMVFGTVRITKSHSGDHASVICTCTKNRLLTILVIIRYIISFWRRVFSYFERRRKKEYGEISLIHPISLHH